MGPIFAFPCTLALPPSYFNFTYLNKLLSKDSSSFVLPHIFISVQRNSDGECSNYRSTTLGAWADKKYKDTWLPIDVGAHEKVK